MYARRTCRFPMPFSSASWAGVCPFAPVAAAWLCLPTCHLFWGDNAEGLPVRATKGVDQRCPLSPALFAIGLAASLERIKAQLVGVSPSCRVFSYLDDVMVVIPAAFAETALNAVVTELEGVGLTVNADKTAVWTKDPLTPESHSMRGLGSHCSLA